MRDVLPILQSWAEDGRRFATATVTQTWGSSPRPIGSTMGVREDGLVCGSVSGGCVETAVIEASIAALQDGKPREMVFHGLEDGAVWDVGLSCGGKIQVWIDPDPAGRDVETWRRIEKRVRTDEPIVVATTIEPFERIVWTPDDCVAGAPPELTAEIEAAYRSRTSGTVQVLGRTWFLHVLACRERLVIVGAVHIAMPLIQFAKALGFETIVVDPRAALASIERFQNGPDRIVVDWPDKALRSMPLTEATYAVTLTHDPKIDDAALAILLRSPVAYIGALGSRTTQAKRRRDLTALGFTESEIDRIHGPVGLNIGARTPEEIALSIIAEIVQVRNANR